MENHFQKSANILSYFMVLTEQCADVRCYNMYILTFKKFKVNDSHVQNSSSTVFGVIYFKGLFCDCALHSYKVEKNI